MARRTEAPQPYPHREHHWFQWATAAVGIPVALLALKLYLERDQGPIQVEAPRLPVAGRVLSEPTPSPLPPTPPPEKTKTPEPTATPTSKPTETPTATSTPDLPKPTSLTAENIDRFTVVVPPDEFQNLIQSQPNKFVFPVKPLNKDVEITYTDSPPTSPADKSSFKAMRVESSGMIEIFSPIEGEISFRRTDPRNKERITQIYISKQISPDTTLQTYVSATTLVPMIGDGKIKAGTPVAKVSGDIRSDISLFQKLPQPIVINRPDGGQTKILAYVTYLTPSIFESSGWVSKDGKIAIPQG